MNKIEKQFLKPMEAAVALNVSKSRLYEALHRNEVPSIRVAGQVRIPRQWIDSQVKEAMTGTAPTQPESDEE